MLRVAASDDPRLAPLAGVVAVSPVLHPDSAMRAMEQGWQVYQRYFVRKWSALAAAQAAAVVGRSWSDEDIFRLRRSARA